MGVNSLWLILWFQLWEGAGQGPHHPSLAKLVDRPTQLLQVQKTKHPWPNPLNCVYDISWINSCSAFSFFQNTWLPVRCPWSPWQVKQFHKNPTSTVLTQHCWSNTITYSGGFFLANLAWFCHSWLFILINIRSSGLMWNQILVPAEKKSRLPGLIFVKVPWYRKKVYVYML